MHKSGLLTEHPTKTSKFAHCAMDAAIEFGRGSAALAAAQFRSFTTEETSPPGYHDLRISGKGMLDQVLSSSTYHGSKLREETIAPSIQQQHVTISPPPIHQENSSLVCNRGKLKPLFMNTNGMLRERSVPSLP
ncbi:hypothetical protein AVEN_59231-1 [Araneus ventricosus]|uniref:Uncharacterized protein n=1 Tax=Araneus ventricosus TaxID=182803 RepID=A0A4Y2CXP8_ARAVE|nr:hypothetical protein AVEN_59231-1 [Araneus ventricosus]